MRKILIMVFSIIMMASFAACTPQEAEPTTEPAKTPEPTQTVSSEPAKPSEPEPTPEPTPVPLPQTLEDAAAVMLENPQELFGEGTEQMTENMGGQFGSIEVKEPADGYFQFVSEEDGAYMPLNTRLKDFGGDGRAQQAFGMRFMPDPAKNLSFTLMGMGEVVISFEGDGVYCTYVQAVEKVLIGGFTLEQGKWYNILLATDENMMLRVIAWEDGNYENQLFYEKDLYIGMDDIYESNWHVTIGFDPSCTLNVSNYSVYTFDKLTENPPVAAGQDGQ